MNALWNSFETLLGLSVEPKNLTFVQISLRGIIVFLATLAMVRLGHKRSAFTQDAVRRRSAGNSRLGAFARDQWFGGIFCHNRRGRGFSVASPSLRSSGILFPRVRHFGQRQA